jgi:hypothetical protein
MTLDLVQALVASVVAGRRPRRGLVRWLAESFQGSLSFCNSVHRPARLSRGPSTATRRSRSSASWHPVVLAITLRLVARPQALLSEGPGAAAQALFSDPCSVAVAGTSWDSRALRKRTRPVQPSCLPDAHRLPKSCGEGLQNTAGARRSRAAEGVLSKVQVA